MPITAAVVLPTTTCEFGFKEQRVPDASSRGSVTRILIEMHPEGEPAIVEEGSDWMTPGLTDAFEKAKALVPAELPDALPQSCCPGGSYVEIDFSDSYAMYGPCDLPDIIDEVRQLVQTAAYANR